ncbi:MAG: DUF4388 domain-containing protein [Verrucomicrobia bacterium]|nr:DUF4388 domain-containing protein [Verrucomicrobiota bacterium]MDA1087420.1 DUF4388 domain-containing protein [Verrucomicrobiota bacterium]
MDPEPKLQGDVERGRIAELVRFLAAQNQRTGVLEVRSESRGSAKIWFEAGGLLAAETEDLKDEEALSEILNFEDGQFEFTEAEEVPERRISLDVQTVILDALGIAKEEAASGVEPVPSSLSSALKGQTPAGTVTRWKPNPNPGPKLPPRPKPKPKPEPDAEAPSEPGAEPGSVPDAEPAIEPDAVPGTVPGTVPGAEPSADADAEPGAVPDAEPDAVPVPAIEPEPRPEEGSAKSPPGDDGDTPGAPSMRSKLKLAILSALIIAEAIVIVWAVHPRHRRRWEAVVAQEHTAEVEAAAAHERRVGEILARGDAFLQTNDMSSALRCYQDAKILAPADPRIDSIIAGVTAMVRERRLAALAAREAEQRRAQTTAMRQSVDELIALGDKDEQAGDLEAALARYKKALAIDANDRSIQSLILNVQARIEEHEPDAIRGSDEPVIGDEKRRTAERLIVSGDAHRLEKRFQEALSDYTAALVIDPDNKAVRGRIATVRRELSATIRPARPKNEWSAIIRVGSMTVQPLALDAGRSIDMLITAKGGIVSPSSTVARSKQPIFE